MLQYNYKKLKFYHTIFKINFEIKNFQKNFFLINLEKYYKNYKNIINFKLDLIKK